MRLAVDGLLLVTRDRYGAEGMECRAGDGCWIGGYVGMEGWEVRSRHQIRLWSGG